MSISRESFDIYVQSLNITSNEAKNRLFQIWSGLDAKNPAEARDMLVAAYPAISAAYGDAAAAAASIYYRDTRIEQGLADRFETVLADTASVGELEADVRETAGPLFSSDRERTLAYLNERLDLRVKQAARDTMILNASRDPARPRFARVPTGARTCAWCVMMASYGYSYSMRSGDIRKFHANCDCQISVSFDGGEVGGYDLSRYRDMVRQAEAAAGTRGTADVLAKMRELFPGALSDGAAVHADYSLLSRRQYRQLKPYERDGFDYLQSMGHAVRPLPEDPAAKANIDMLLDGRHYELKTPLMGENAIQRRINEGVTKWARLQSDGKLLGDSPRIAVDNRYSVIGDEKAYRKVVEQVEYHGIEEALFIGKDGRVRIIKQAPHFDQ